MALAGPPQVALIARAVLKALPSKGASILAMQGAVWAGP
jgi:hypothetical protein